jgi:hypothetical protein
MIKNTIIVILLLLLLITFYAYLCLSNNMMDYQKERMEHILQKEKELKDKESKLISLGECNDNMNKYKNIINKLSSDLTKTASNFNEIVNFVNLTNSSIDNDIKIKENFKMNMDSNLNQQAIVFTDVKENFEIVEENNELDNVIDDLH